MMQCMHTGMHLSNDSKCAPGTQMILKARVQKKADKLAAGSSPSKEHQVGTVFQGLPRVSGKCHLPFTGIEIAHGTPFCFSGSSMRL